MIHLRCSLLCYRYLIIAIIIISVGLVMGGCMNNETSLTATKNDLLKYISEKYPDDTFTFQCYSGGHVGSENHTIIVSSNKYPGEIIYVNVINGEKSDNYPYIARRTEIESAVGKMIQSVYGDCHVRYTMPTNPIPNSAENGLDCPLKDILEDGIIVEIVLSDRYDISTKDELLNSLCEACRYNGISVSGTVSYCRDSKSYDGYMDLGKDAQHSFEKCDKEFGEFIIDDTYKLSYVNWEKY